MERPRAKNKPTLWHQSFVELVAERAPSDIEAHIELKFRSIPNRSDLLLVRRDAGHRRDHEARVLRGLWPHIERAALVEFKSPARQFRRNGLINLTIYGRLYHREQRDLQAMGKPYVIDGPEQLTLVLVIPKIVEALTKELADMGWQCEPLGSGYARIVGPVYNTILALLDDICEAEKDEYLRLFSNHPVTERAALFWWNRWQHKVTMENIEDVEGSDELFAKLLESLPPRLRLAGLSPDVRLAGLSPDVRLAGLSPEERLAGLDLERVLNHLARLDPEALVRLQKLIRKRLNGSD